MMGLLGAGLLLAAISYAECQLVVDLPNGKIEGFQQTTYTKKVYNAYQGIPFAQPPVGNLRFQAPQPAKNWSGTLETKAYSDYCYNMDSDAPEENEDCLYLNVFTPILNADQNTTKLPVVFSIYGGGFRNGKAGISPRYWIDNDIVLVSHNYRIAAFGFLATGDTVVPGNAGLKDQNLALQWTYDNIHLFGGDRDRITIMGQSAGGASVGYHLLSPKSRGLFRAGIAESGSPLNTWTYLEDPLDYAFELAQTINSSIPSDLTSAQLLDFLQSVDAKAIDNAQAIIKTRPVIFTEPEHDGAFITKPMYESFESGDYTKVPLILGVNSEERITIISDLDSVAKSAAQRDADPSKVLPDTYHLKSGVDKNEAADIIYKAYAGDAKLADHLGKYVKWESDNRFTRGVIKQGLLMSNYSPVYFYQFSYDGVIGGFNLTIAEADRVSHGEEQNYLSTPGAVGDLDSGDALTHNRMIQMWTDFIKKLNPTPAKLELLQNLIWPQVAPDSYQYLNINDTLKIENTPKAEQFLAWQNLFDTYMQRPFTTY
ncbi:juvenile hormone esterase-like [Cylas formicarius]|uniref:juvenile hormone esterase-like n=1 Tax=Cylas formicarius TaxID=197179 RepID=UPI0029589DC5|nr:juvenile hormone esterase-like [Cylas formicarius]